MDILLIVALVALAIGFSGGWTVNDWRETAAKVEAVKAAQAAQDEQTRRANEISTKFEGKLANLRIVNRTINNEVRHETERTVYTECVVPDSGRLLLSRSISSANAATGQPVPAVSSSGSAAKPADDGRTPDVGNGSGGYVWGMRFPTWWPSGNNDKAEVTK